MSDSDEYGEMSGDDHADPGIDFAVQAGEHTNYLSVANLRTPDRSPSHHSGSPGEGVSQGRQIHQQYEYPQDGYPQDGYPQDEFLQDEYPHDEHPQDGYEEDEYGEDEYGKAEYEEDEYEQDEYEPAYSRQRMPEHISPSLQPVPLQAAPPAPPNYVSEPDLPSNPPAMSRDSRQRSHFDTGM